MNTTNDDDLIFQEEQRHLSETYASLQEIGSNLERKMAKLMADVAQDKYDMADEMTGNFASDAEKQETYIEYVSANRVIEGYNIAQQAYAEKLSTVELLLRQPYFAKIVLQYKEGEESKELYIGSAGISDDSYRRLVVDWRSPVAEVYYNQVNGPTSYAVNGCTIEVDLKLRRQFDIERDRLKAYFDTTVVINDALLLASLSEQRTAQMRAITATIQKEQNLVIRHEDVPVLLVAGIAGSGKTSVLLQRIAYLFFQQRSRLQADEVYLVSPNPVFRRYIDGVLPDMGERNPQIATWNEFVSKLMPADYGAGSGELPLERILRIEQGIRGLEFEPGDFQSVQADDLVCISVQQIRRLSEKYAHIPAGPHRVTLMREEIIKRLDARLDQLAAEEQSQNEMLDIGIQEQLRLFGETCNPQTEEEARAYTRIYLRDRYAEVYERVEHDVWLRFDRIGKRLLGAESLSGIEWLYVRMAVSGLSDPSIKYVMIDEVQDYTSAQLAVFARYFRRAHFLLLGDENQAIQERSSSFAEVRAVFEQLYAPVEECCLMTSYRSSPEITALFTSLLSFDVKARVSSVQRPGIAPEFVICPDEQAQRQALRTAVSAASAQGGTTAVIVPWNAQLKHLQSLLEGLDCTVVKDDDALPAHGVALIALTTAKGLEFDRVIIPDASEQVFPDTSIARRRLYTTISRATRGITILSRGALTPLLSQVSEDAKGAQDVNGVKGAQDTNSAEGANEAERASNANAAKTASKKQVAKTVDSTKTERGSER